MTLDCYYGLIFDLPLTSNHFRLCNYYKCVWNYSVKLKVSQKETRTLVIVLIIGVKFSHLGGGSENLVKTKAHVM